MVFGDTTLGESATKVKNYFIRPPSPEEQAKWDAEKKGNADRKAALEAQRQRNIQAERRAREQMKHDREMARITNPQAGGSRLGGIASSFATGAGNFIHNMQKMDQESGLGGGFGFGGGMGGMRGFVDSDPTAGLGGYFGGGGGRRQRSRPHKAKRRHVVKKQKKGKRIVTYTRTTW